MAAVIMVDRSASDSGRGVATAATSPSGAPADRVRSLKSIFGHFHASENALRLRLTEEGSDGQPMPWSAGPGVCALSSAVHAVSWGSVALLNVGGGESPFGSMVRQL